MEAVGVGLAEAEGALTDGAGRAEDGDLLHTAYFSPAVLRERRGEFGAGGKESGGEGSLEGKGWGRYRCHNGNRGVKRE
jgi:hypothetical protein